MADFTRHRHPVLAVPCPTCGASAGAWCTRPSGHRAASLHTARASEADCVFIEQHGELASIARADETWLIDPRGRARD